MSAKGSSRFALAKDEGGESERKSEAFSCEIAGID
jgi:hypothetical protein